MATRSDRAGVTRRATRQATRWVAGGLLTAALLFGLAGATAKPAPVVKGDGFITAETPGILNIEGGECFDDPAYDRGANEILVLYRPCEESADNQAYGFLHAADGPWDQAKLRDFAWDGCRAAFVRRWTSTSVSNLDFYPILPTEETWADGDRTVMCAVYNPTGRLADSVLPLRR
jgi:hypothetical protein